MPEVVLPVLNEREALTWVLERLPAGNEPIVADNGSTDGSGALAASLGARVLREPQPGFGAACFAGLETARSEVVCFMDCDASSPATSRSSPIPSPPGTPTSCRARLAAAFEDAGAPAFLVGMDTPQVTSELLDAGLCALEHADAAFGAALDGG